MTEEVTESAKLFDDAAELRAVHQRLADTLQDEVDTVGRKLAACERAAAGEREGAARARLEADAELSSAQLARAELRARVGAAHAERVSALSVDAADARAAADAAGERHRASEAARRADAAEAAAASAAVRAELADVLAQLQTAEAERDRRGGAADRLAAECEEALARAHAQQAAAGRAEGLAARAEARAAEAAAALEVEELKAAAEAAVVKKLEAERKTLVTGNADLSAEVERRAAEALDARRDLREAGFKLEAEEQQVEQLRAELEQQKALQRRGGAGAGNGDDGAEAVRRLRSELEASEVENRRLVELRGADADEVRELMERLYAAEAAMSEHHLPPPPQQQPSDTVDDDLRRAVEERDSAILALKDKLARATKARTDAERRERAALKKASEAGGVASVSLTPAPPSPAAAPAAAVELRAALDELGETRAAAATLQTALRNKEMEVLMLRKEAEASAQELAALAKRYEDELSAQRTSADEVLAAKEQGWAGRLQAAEARAAAREEGLRTTEVEKKLLDQRVQHAEARVAAAEDRLVHAEAEKLHLTRARDEGAAAAAAAAARAAADAQLASDAEVAQREAEAAGLRDLLAKAEAESAALRQYIEAKHHEALPAQQTPQPQQQQQRVETERVVGEVKAEAKRREELLLGQIRTLLNGQQAHAPQYVDATRSIDFRDRKAVSPPLPAGKGVRSVVSFSSFLFFIAAWTSTTHTHTHR